MFRYTIKELEEMTDYDMLRAIVVERKESITNIHSPLCKRLDNLYNKLYNKLQLTK